MNITSDIKSENSEKTQIDTVFSVSNLLKKAFSGIHFSQLKYRSWRTKAGILLVVAAIFCGLSTYCAFTQSPPLGKDPNTVIWLLNLDLVILWKK